MPNLDKAKELKEFKADHSGGDVVKGAELEDEKAMNAEDPKADGKTKKNAEKADKSATKVKMKIEDTDVTATKSGMINKILDEMQGMPKADLADIFGDLVSTMTEQDALKPKGDNDDDDDDKDIDDEEDDKKNPFAKKEAKKVTKEDLDIAADVGGLFEGEDLSEDFKRKAITVFETVVVMKVNEKLDEITEETTVELTEAKETMVADLAEKVDVYLDYIVEKWVETNDLAIESGIRSELAESFLGGLKGLFEDHYMDIPEDKVDVLEEMGNRIQELEGQLDESINETVELTTNVASYKKSDILEEVSKGLVDTDASKLRQLSESVDFENADDYRTKMETLKENYFPGTGVKPKVQSLNEDVSDQAIDDGTPMVQGSMAAYSSAISRTTSK